MARIDTHRAAYTRVNPNMRVGKQRPSKQSLIDRLTAINADLEQFNNASLPETERMLVVRAMECTMSARRALKIMITK